jgi:hypothetical protein
MLLLVGSSSRCWCVLIVDTVAVVGNESTTFQREKNSWDNEWRNQQDQWWWWRWIQVEAITTTSIDILAVSYRRLPRANLLSVIAYKRFYHHLGAINLWKERRIVRVTEIHFKNDESFVYSRMVQATQKRKTHAFQVVLTNAMRVTSVFQNNKQLSQTQTIRIFRICVWRQWSSREVGWFRDSILVAAVGLRY